MRRREAKIIPVIRVAVTIGKGTDDDPTRDGFEYWDTDRKLLFVGEADYVMGFTSEPKEFDQPVQRSIP